MTTLTPAGRVFLNHARLALSQVEAATDGARRAEQPEWPAFTLGFLAGQEGRVATACVAHHAGGSVTIIPLYAQNMRTPNVVAPALEGVPPTIDLTLGYNEANSSPLLRRFLARADELVANVQNQSIIRYAEAL